MENRNASAIIRKAFSLEVAIIKKLPSYDDLNLLVQDIKSGERFVYKQLKGEMDEEDQQNAENRARCAKLLENSNFLCSSFVLGENGKFVQFVNETGLKNRDSLCMLYRFMPGIEAETTECFRNAFVSFELGVLLGSLHKTLSCEKLVDFSPDDTDPWILTNLTLLPKPKYVKKLKSKKKQDFMSEVLLFVNTVFKKHKHVLQKGLLHGDLHGRNIIVSKDFSVSEREKQIKKNLTSDITNKHEFSEQSFQSLHLFVDLLRDDKCIDVNDVKKTYGIIDFGDLCEGYTVLDLGRLLADSMVMNLCQTYPDWKDLLKTSADQTSKPTGAESLVSDEYSKDERSQACGIDLETVVSEAGFVLAGYFYGAEEVTEGLLSPVVLKASVMWTLSQYYILGTIEMEKNPENSEYVGQTAEEAEAMLKYLHPIPPDTLATWLTTAALKLHTR